MHAVEPDRIDPDLLEPWREALRAAAFDEAFLAECEAVAPRMLDAVRGPVVRWWLRQQEHPAAVLARLWGYGDAVQPAAVDAVLDPGLRRGLTEAGVLRETGEGLRGGLRLMPFCGLWIASDEMHGDDPVMGPGATTQQLAQTIGEVARRRVLDVGCGAGSLALVAAARGAREVVGVDLHPAAAAWSGLNAGLNGLSLELHTGDLTAPVEGRQFDLVLAQPPFVVQPPDVDATTYLHGGAMGDELAMRLLGELPPLLPRGGEARVLLDSPVRADAPLWQRVDRAHGDDGLQQLLFVAPGNDPARQAIGYAANGHPSLGPRYAEAVERYRAHLHAQGIERCEHALVVLRRPVRGSGLSVTVDRPAPLGVTARTLARSWAALEIASRSTEALAWTRVRLPAGARLVQEQAVDGSDARLTLRLSAERGGDHALSDAAAMLIAELREPISVEVLVQRYAAACELPADEVRPGVVDFVRQSLVVGRITTDEEDA